MLLWRKKKQICGYSPLILNYTYIKLYLLSTGYHEQKQIEIENQQQSLLEPEDGIRNVPPSLTRFSVGPSSRFTSASPHLGPRQGSTSPRPVSLTRAAPRGANVRHEPYPTNQPRKSNQSGKNSVSTPKQTSSVKRSKDSENIHKSNSKETIKIEAGEEEDTKKDFKMKTSDITDDNSVENVPSSNQVSVSKSSKKSSIHENVASESEMMYTDTLPPEGLRLETDVSNLSDSGAPNINTDDDNYEQTEYSDIGVKVEPSAEPEMNLELTGVELARMAQSDDDWVQSVQNVAGYGPSTSGAEGGDTLAGQSSSALGRFCFLIYFTVFRGVVKEECLVIILGEIFWLLR